MITKSIGSASMRDGKVVARSNRVPGNVRCRGATTGISHNSIQFLRRIRAEACDLSLELR